jgi:hypothetical protein
MSLIDEVINFLVNDLNIKISNKKRDQIINKFYPDVEDKIYWSIDINERVMTFFYEGIVSKDEYEKIKKLPPDTNIYFGSHAKYVDEVGNLSEISFKDDINEIKKLYDEGFKESSNYFDLMGYLFDQNKFNEED